MAEPFVNLRQSGQGGDVIVNQSESLFIVGQRFGGIVELSLPDIAEFRRETCLLVCRHLKLLFHFGNLQHHVPLFPVGVDLT